MTDIILVGAGGCMRELVWQILEQNRQKNTWHIIGYVDHKKPENEYGVTIGQEAVRYLGDDDYLLQLETAANIVISIGSSKERERIAEKLSHNPNLRFPNVILSNVVACDDACLGQGCIISMDCRISTHVSIGNFVFLNMGSRVCHDGMIGDYVTLGIDAVTAGNVTIGGGTDIGLGARIIQGISVGSKVIIGAGSIVIRDTDSNCTIAGVPAKRI